jgi:hypothetical protein
MPTRPEFAATANANLNPTDTGRLSDGVAAVFILGIAGGLLGSMIAPVANVAPVAAMAFFGVLVGGLIGCLISYGGD